MDATRAPWRAAPALAVLVALAPACAGDDGASPAVTDAPATAAASAPASDGALFDEVRPSGDVGGGDGATTDGGDGVGGDGGDGGTAVPATGGSAPATVTSGGGGVAGSAVVESLPAVAETGVPGIGSDDELCRSWSEYAGSFAALAGGWQVLEPTDAARLEVAASSALVDAVDGLAEHLPAELEGEREAFTVDVPGPMLRRAERAASALDAAGLDGAGRARLGEAWLAALADAGLDPTSIELDVGPADAGPLDAAAAEFADDVPPMGLDPSLDTTEYDISDSLAFVTAECPDQGTLGGNDDVGADTG